MFTKRIVLLLIPIGVVLFFSLSESIRISGATEWTPTAAPYLAVRGFSADPASSSAAGPARASAPPPHHHDFTTLDPRIPSCHFHGSGHKGREFGPVGGRVHWSDAIDYRNVTQACLESSCGDVFGWCCFTRFMHVLVWYVDALRRYNVEHFLSDGSLIGAMRSGGMPTEHYDAEIHVVLRTPEDEEKMWNITREAAQHTPHIHPRQYGNWLFTDNYVRVDTYKVRRNGSHWCISYSKTCLGGAVNDSMLFPLSVCNFYGLDIPCPSKPVEYLNAIYYKHKHNNASWWFHKIKGVSQRDLIPSFEASMRCMYDGGYATLLREWSDYPDTTREVLRQQGYSVSPQRPGDGMVAPKRDHKFRRGRSDAFIPYGMEAHQWYHKFRHGRSDAFIQYASVRSQPRSN